MTTRIHPSNPVWDSIENTVTHHPIVLYMKGSPTFPQCGFSSLAVQLLNDCGVNDFLAVDVLQDDEIRQGIKDYSNWPTVPQLYVHGKFIGGSDIMQAMHQSGELQAVLDSKPS